MEFSNNAAMRPLSDARDRTVYSKRSRLEFSSFSVVEQLKSDLLLTDYPAAKLPLLHLLLLEYLAARSTASSISRRFLSLKAVRAAIKRSVFIGYSSPLKPILQQAVIVKVFLPTCRDKQIFPITPSELNLFFSREPLEFVASREQVVDLTSAGEVQ